MMQQSKRLRMVRTRRKMPSLSQMLQLNSLKVLMKLPVRLRSQSL